MSVVCSVHPATIRPPYLGSATVTKARSYSARTADTFTPYAWTAKTPFAIKPFWGNKVQRGISLLSLTRVKIKPVLLLSDINCYKANISKETDVRHARQDIPTLHFTPGFTGHTRNTYTRSQS